MPLLIVALVVLLNLFFLRTAPVTLAILVPVVAVFLSAMSKAKAPDR